MSFPFSFDIAGRYDKHQLNKLYATAKQGFAISKSRIKKIINATWKSRNPNKKTPEIQHLNFGSSLFLYPLTPSPQGEGWGEVISSTNDSYLPVFFLWFREPFSKQK